MSTNHYQLLHTRTGHRGGFKSDKNVRVLAHDNITQSAKAARYGDSDLAVLWQSVIAPDPGGCGYFFDANDAPTECTKARSRSAWNTAPRSVSVAIVRHA